MSALVKIKDLKHRMENLGQWEMYKEGIGKLHIDGFIKEVSGIEESAAAELLALREELSTAKVCLELSEGKLRFTKSELTDAKARAKTAEANWHANEARLGKLQIEKDARLEFYKTSAEAWKEFANHQEYCAVCADSVDNCEIGSGLRSIANVSFDDVISL